ncbi:MAG TPA: protein kinase, partial [Haliangium sp.]|nr:protein kinase [Haliangium sp.]
MKPPDHLETLPADTPSADTPPALPATARRSPDLELARFKRVIGDRFHPLRLLGKGGAGSVFEAMDTRLERPVAIKIMGGSLEGAALKRLRREAQAMARVQGQHVLRIYELGIGADDVPFIVMELADGSLAEAMKPGEPVDPRIAVEVVRQAAAGLASLHDGGLVHRDIKPSN